MKLSQQQKDIAKTYLSTQDNIEVESVAGSGKTTLLVGMSNILKTHNYLFVAFTNSAKDEMIKRMPKMASSIKTTYSLGFGALRNYHNDIDFNIDKNKAYGLIREALEDPEMVDVFEDITDQALTGEVLDVMVYELVSHYKLTLINLKISQEEVYEYTLENYDFSYDHLVGWVSSIIYEAIKKGYDMLLEDGVIDFTDMIAWPAIEDNITLPKYSEIFIDEAHDLSAAQQTIILKMCSEQTQVIYVVDPRQAIFAFAGADANSVQSMANNFSPNKTRLNECYRCGTAIIDEIVRSGLHNDIVAAPGNPEGKVTRPGYYEAIEDIAYSSSETMVLARTHSHLVDVAIKLLKEEKPFYYYQGTFGTELNNFIKVHTRGKKIGDWNAIKKTLSSKKSFDASIKNKDLVKAVDTFLKLYNAKTWSSLRQSIQRFFRKANNKSANLRLMTMHSCKGQEAKNVYLFYDFKRLDNATEMEEQEYNLLYVAYSRAKLSLNLVSLS